MNAVTFSQFDLELYPEDVSYLLLLFTLFVPAGAVFLVTHSSIIFSQKVTHICEIFIIGRNNPDLDSRLLHFNIEIRNGEYNEIQIVNPIWLRPGITKSSQNTVRMTGCSVVIASSIMAEREGLRFCSNYFFSI